MSILERVYAPSRNMCGNSTGGVRLNQPMPCSTIYGERAFSVCLWNSLPLELCLIRSYSRFKLNQKTLKKLFCMNCTVYYFMHAHFTFHSF